MPLRFNQQMVAAGLVRYAGRDVMGGYVEPPDDLKIDNISVGCVRISKLRTACSRLYRSKFLKVIPHYIF